MSEQTTHDEQMVEQRSTEERVLPLVVLGEAWAETLEEAHETVGNVFYAVIALHTLAALWHQFVRRDGVLRRMW